MMRPPRRIALGTRSHARCFGSANAVGIRSLWRSLGVSWSRNTNGPQPGSTETLGPANGWPGHPGGRTRQPCPQSRHARRVMPGCQRTGRGLGSPVVVPGARRRGAGPFVRRRVSKESSALRPGRASHATTRRRGAPTVEESQCRRSRQRLGAEFIESRRASRDGARVGKVEQVGSESR